MAKAYVTLSLKQSKLTTVLLKAAVIANWIGAKRITNWCVKKVVDKRLVIS